MWVEDIVNELISKNPGKSEFVIQVGISTTGRIHVGNAREVLIAYFVNSYLNKLVYQTKFSLSFDHYDRLKKIPFDGSADIYSPFIGKPNYLAPAPNSDCGCGYAAMFEHVFLRELASLNVFPEPIYQWKKYTQGAYRDYIKIFYKQRRELYACIQSFKTRNLDVAYDTAFVPFIMYCENCNSSYVKFESLLDDAITYHCCSCGNTKTVSVSEIRTAKLIFKADWAMRWDYEKVDFEPNGKAHMDKNGAFNVASEIAKKFLHRQPPLSIPYEFVKLKGDCTRMSKSAGNIITLTELLDIFPPEMVLWQYIRVNPNSELYLSTDEWVKSIYAEFERFIKTASLCANNREVKIICDLCGINLSETTPTFKALADYIPFCDGKISNLSFFLDINLNDKATYNKAKYAMNWSKKMNKLKESYVLSSEEIEFLKELYMKTKLSKLATTEQLMKIILDVMHSKQLKNYSVLYKVLFGLVSGPKLSKIIDIYGVEWFCKRLENANEEAIG